MKIVHVGEFDCAAVGWNLSDAVNRYTKHESLTVFANRTAVAPLSHLRDLEKAESVIEMADVVVAHVGLNTTPTDPRLASLLEPSKCIAWFNGSTYLRENYGAFKERYAGWRMAATNTDVAVEMGAEFVPAPVISDLDTGAIRHEMFRLTFDVLGLMQTYTDHRVKDTEQVAKAANKFPGVWRWMPVHGVKHPECLRLRQEAHVLVDHMQGYFGVCSVEALAAGMPSIVGMDDDCVRLMGDWCGSQPPWMVANNTLELIEVLRGLAGDPWPLLSMGRAARAWYEKNFTNRHKAERFVQWLEAS